MSEGFDAGVCGGTWWSSSTNLLRSPRCLPDIINDGCAWPSDNHLLDMKTTRSNDESCSASDDSIVLQDVQQSLQPDLASGNISIDSTLRMMGISLPSSSTSADLWNLDLIHDNGGLYSGGNYSRTLQENLNTSMNYRQQTGINCPQIQNDWSLKNHPGIGEDPSVNSFEQVNRNFAPKQQPVNSSIDCVIPACQDLSTDFPWNSTTSFGLTSSLMQSLFAMDSQPQQSTVDNRAMSYPSTSNSFSKAASFVKPSFTKQQTGIQVPKYNMPTIFFSPTQSQFRPSSHNMTTNVPNLVAKRNIKEAVDLCSIAKKTCNEPAFKRQRIETPSPLPTFKVRKEKMGDRVTALQQLVSPFGKTDTASVLHEAIEYIKFLHDQVNGLTSPYMKSGSPQIQRQRAADDQKDDESLRQDLRSRGLCLVPISSTFPVAPETTADFWTPTFGGTFR